MEIILDEGYLYGLAVFETIAVENGTPIFLTNHLKRMWAALQTLSINNVEWKEKVNETAILEYLIHNPMDHGVVKIMVSQKNIIFSTRENPYGINDYAKGMHVDYAKVLRNETSLFTYLKSNQYGDNIIEKRTALQRKIDEPIFLNTKGQLTEGATSNLFFIKNGVLLTPIIKSGLLNGIMRQYVIDTYTVEERVIYPSEIGACQEMFLTNSLMGIMPVHSFGNHKFDSQESSFQMHLEYQNYVNKKLSEQV